MMKTSSNVRGVLFLLLSVLIGSLQSVAVKWIGCNYSVLDLTIMCGLGFVWAAWMYFMTRAYSMAQASVVAPFEYASLPIHIMWGLIIWHELPTRMTVAGAVLTLLSGMYILFQERQERPIVHKSAMDHASLGKNI